MSRGVLLDTNLLIGALAITPLIRYEVLRGIILQEDERFGQMKQALGGFEEFDIGRDISELAANLFRFDRNEAASVSDGNHNIEKRKFDVFHLASAECNTLELASEDSDIAKLKALYQRFIESSIQNKE